MCIYVLIHITQLWIHEMLRLCVGVCVYPRVHMHICMLICMHHYLYSYLFICSEIMASWNMTHTVGGYKCLRSI